MSGAGRARLRSALGGISVLGVLSVASAVSVLGTRGLAHADGVAIAAPADLLDRPEADSQALDRLFASFRNVKNFHATFTEEKKLTLLVKPLKSDGTLYFDREHGLARHAKTPKVQKLRLTETSLTLWNGTTVEHVNLDQSRDLSALALSFPRILRGDRPGLAKTFAMKMQGTETAWWALTLAPTEDSLKRMLSGITIVGHGDSVQSVIVQEANGDRTRTLFTDVHKNVQRSASETEALFRLP